MVSRKARRAFKNKRKKGLRMIIDETFIWLYVTSKVGDALCVLGVVSAVVGVISAIVLGFNIEDSNWTNSLVTVRRMFFTMLVTAFVSLSLSALTPSKSDATAYAAYVIGKDVTSSAEAKRLFEAAINYIEGNTRKEQDHE